MVHNPGGDWNPGRRDNPNGNYLSRDKDGCTPNVRVYPWYLLCSLGILGDYNPYIPTIHGLYRDFPKGYVGIGVHPTIP